MNIKRLYSTYYIDLNNKLTILTSEVNRNDRRKGVSQPQDVTRQDPGESKKRSNQRDRLEKVRVLKF